MPGRWTVTRNGSSAIHTFTAPEEGWLVTSHIIELPSQLLAVDAQYTLAFAREVTRYAFELKKPVTRLFCWGRRHLRLHTSRSQAWPRRSARPARDLPLLARRDTDSRVSRLHIPAHERQAAEGGVAGARGA